MTSFTHKPIGSLVKYRVSDENQLTIDDAGILYNVRHSPTAACMPGEELPKHGYVFLYRKLSGRASKDQLIFQGRDLITDPERSGGPGPRAVDFPIERIAMTRDKAVQVTRTISLDSGKLTVTTTLTNLSRGDVQVTGFCPISECPPGCEPPLPCQIYTVLGADSRTEVLPPRGSISISYAMRA